jgi:membrane-associated phospholipid phosphatase
MKIKIFFFFLLSINVFSQSFGDDVNHVLLTGRNVFTAPLSWDSKDFINLGATVGLTAIAFAADNESFNLAKRNHSSFNDELFKADQVYYIPTCAVLTAGLYGYGVIEKDKDIRRLGLNLGEAILYSAIVDEALKIIVGRTRPYAGLPKSDFHPFQKSFERTSFPSGHTTLAFAVSTVMANYYDNIWWQAGWYTAAGLVGAARIYHEKHWLSDVVAGGLISHFIADYISGKPLNKEQMEISVIPGGLYVRYNF